MRRTRRRPNKEEVGEDEENKEEEVVVVVEEEEEGRLPAPTVLRGSWTRAVVAVTQWACSWEGLTAQASAWFWSVATTRGPSCAGCASHAPLAEQALARRSLASAAATLEIGKRGQRYQSPRTTHLALR